MLGRTQSFLLALSVSLWAPHAGAEGAINAVAGPGVGVSGGNGWRGDGAIPSASLRLAYRFPIGVGPVILAREGYAKVDQRVLTLLSVGAQGWLDLGTVKPHLRLGWAHQHEESWAFAKEEPFGVVFGVGRGIRHRGGVSTALGADVALAHSERLTWLASAEAWLDWLPSGEAPGPAYYAGATLAAGVEWAP